MFTVEDLLKHYPVLTSSESADTPGLAVTVLGVDDEAVGIYHGCANLDWRSSIGPSTKFHAASLAKQFTALAILQLRDQGLLALDAPVDGFIPELQVAGSPITLRHLLSHTSGLRDQWALIEWAGWRGNDTVTTDDVLSLIFRQSDTMFEPGSRYMYSNSGYTLLAEVVARLTCMSFATYANEEIFSKLGMANTLISDDPTAIIHARAEGYRFDSEQQIYTRYGPSLHVAGSTSLLTTPTDYTQWMLAHRQGSPWRRLIDEMQQPHSLSDGTRIGYGLAYFLSCEDGVPVAFHSGGDFGFTAYFAHYPTISATVAIFTNTPRQDLRKIARRLIGDIRDGRPSFVDRRPTFQSAIKSSARHLHVRELSAFAGSYISDLGEVCELKVRDDGLYAVWTVEVQLTQCGVESFQTASGEEYEFSTDYTKRAFELVIHSPLGTSRWKHTRTPAEELDTLNPLSGHYFSSSTGALLEIIELEEGQPALVLPKQESRSLHRIDKWTHVASPL